MVLNRSFIDETRAWVKGFIKDSASDDFEVAHLKDVEKYCVELAVERGLDPLLASLIAILHDIGRIKDKVYGKSHSKRGAEIAVDYLRAHRIDEDTIKTIEKAIKGHNKKKNLGSSFEELIRDADSMAHKLEGIDLTNKRFENARINVIQCKKLEFVMSSTSHVDRVFTEELIHLNQYLQKEKIKKLNDETVHDFRVTIRTIRALIWYMKYDSEEPLALIGLDKALKHVFHYLEDARINYVFIKEVGNLDGFEKTYKKLMKRQITLNKLMIKSLIKFLDSKECAYIKTMSTTGYSINYEPSLNFKKYRTLLFNATIDDLETIHRLRVQGKKFKYLIEHGIIQVDEPLFYKTISALHKTIGRLHDIEENQRLMSIDQFNKAFAIDKSHIKKLEEHYRLEKVNLLKETNIQIFTMKKLIKHKR